MIQYSYRLSVVTSLVGASMHYRIGSVPYTSKRLWSKSNKNSNHLVYYMDRTINILDLQDITYLTFSQRVMQPL